MNPSGWRVTANASLLQRNTFHIAATARWLLHIDDIAAVPEALSQPQWRDLPVLPIGGGSNLLFAGDFDGVALVFCADEVTLPAPAQPADPGLALVRAEAGLPWHRFVLWSLEHGFCGLENLSLIPGTIGACPIQNIGAYGVEVADRIAVVEAWDRQRQAIVRIDKTDCAFGYRDSVFKREPECYVIVAVEFLLPREDSGLYRPKIAYAGIAEELAAAGISQPKASDVSDAIIRIRQRKLPDPAITGNAGSFFKNPVIDAGQAERLQAAHPGIPVFPTGDAALRKLSAAWLIEQAGWKGFREGDAGVSPEHALVLVNHGSASGVQMLALARRIAASVEEKFGVAIEPEPRIIGARW